MGQNLGSSEGVKMWYMPPENGQYSTAPKFWTSPFFFAKDYIGSSEDVKMSYMPPKNGQISNATRFWTFPYFFHRRLYGE